MALVRKADALRAHLGVPIHVSSGVRCKSHNAAVGGVSNSRHLTGKAMDFTALPKMEFPWNLFDLPTLLEEKA